MSQQYFGEHLSLSQWAMQANVGAHEALIQEDGSKRTRLGFLNTAMGLPVVSNAVFTYADMLTPSETFASFRERAGSLPYALRANPKVDGLPVLRNRKLPVQDLVHWISSSGIDFDRYEFSFEQHIDPEVAAILVVTDNRIVGEAIQGGILQLNKGLHAADGGVTFQYNFREWYFTRPSTTLQQFLERAIAYLHVKDTATRRLIEREMGLGFASEYLKGYFEVIFSESSGVVFIDYNRQLIRTADLLNVSSPPPSVSAEVVIVGQCGCIGFARGLARVVEEKDVANTGIGSDEILVCRFTSPDFLPLMTRAAAVVTDVGGVLSHAAIVCRELKKPCVIGTGVGTSRIRTGDDIEVDGASGIVRFHHPSR